MYSSKVSRVNTELNWNVTTTVELFTFDNLQNYSRNGPLNLF